MKKLEKNTIIGYINTNKEEMFTTIDYNVDKMNKELKDCVSYEDEQETKKHYQESMYNIIHTQRDETSGMISLAYSLDIITKEEMHLLTDSLIDTWTKAVKELYRRTL